MPISSVPESAPTSSTSSSDEDDEAKLPLDQLLAEPRKPKADPPVSTVKEIGELPVMRLFNHHLKSFEGGCTKGKSWTRSREKGRPSSLRNKWRAKKRQEVMAESANEQDTQQFFCR